MLQLGVSIPIVILNAVIIILVLISTDYKKDGIVTATHYKTEVVADITSGYLKLVDEYGTIIEIVPNREVRSYHFKFDVPLSMIGDIKKIDGVAQIHPDESSLFYWNRYYVQITKGLAFGWNDIQPKVLEVINKYRIQAEQPFIMGKDEK